MQDHQSILITGGTGSFGRAFVKHLLNLDTKRICIYSRGEHAQAEMRDEFNNDPRLRFLVGDVRDIERLRRAMRGCDAVVHAAALKRIEVGAYNPDEMVKTNILGAMNVIEASVAMHVRKVVYLSTDKAYQPISPYGQSKALAESLMLAANNMHGRKGPTFVVTRYGNVWASKGSVAPRWKEMIERGETILPVTNMECTRFFMLMREAVELVEQALFYESEGTTLIPDWLPAYQLADLVAAFGAEGGKVTGLPEFEKLHESMSDTLCSKDVRRLSIEELRGHINEI